MDRRLMAPGPQQLMRPNSFIPSSTNQSTPSNGGKLGPAQIQQLALQSQLQAQHHGHAPNPRPYQAYNQYGGQGPTAGPTVNHFNGNSPGGSNSQFSSCPTNGSANQNQFSHATLPRHSVALDAPPPHHQSQQQPPLNARTTLQRKTYPTQYGPTLGAPQHQNNADPLYGNLGVHHGHGQGQHGLPHPNTQGYHNQDPQQQTSRYPPPPPIPTNQIQPVINQIQQQHHSAKILQHYPTVASESDGLPPSLVESMRTLFDILDDSKQGRVRLSDIESRWENSDSREGNKGNTGAEPLIKMGVMGYLRKVTPPDGMLTFDRFCSGLRLALVTNHKGSSEALLVSHHDNGPSSHLHVKPVSHNFYANSSRGAIPSGQITSSNSMANKPRPTSLPISTNHNVNQSQMPIVQRGTSRIPGYSVSQSKVPMNPAPISAASPPRSKFSANMAPGGQNFGSGTARRVALNQSQHATEQGTTVVTVHAPPGRLPPSGLPTGTVVPTFSHRPHDIQIGTIKLTKPSLVTPPNGGFTKYKTVSQNGSLDNLKSEDEERAGKTIGKLRPPSAPLLDTTDDDDGGAVEYYGNRNQVTKRERAKSGDRALEGSKQRSGNKQIASEELSFGKRVVSFVTPRQRTLSMPQLQLSKLKSKVVPADDDSSPSLSSSSHSPLSSGETKKGGLKSSLKSASSIPTKMAKQKSESLTRSSDFKHRNGPPEALPSSFKPSYEDPNNDPQAPPKPPRNNSTLTVSVNGGSNTPDQPLSGSSTASTGNHPSKPEIRQFLQSWKRGVAEKRPPNETHPLAPPPLPQQPPPNKLDLQPPPDPEPLNNGTVKLRGDKKLNLRRRETARRHTVQAGIDFATLKRLKQLEQERDVLQQGLDALEASKEWYSKELGGVEEKISVLTKGASVPEQLSDSLEDRLNLLSCRIQEINGLLAVLMDGSTTKIPGHMNLQIPSHLSMRTITRLKEQNRQLTQEVSDCGHRVTQLETEKAMLLRQLFHQKSSHLPEETVYM